MPVNIDHVVENWQSLSFHSVAEKKCRKNKMNGKYFKFWLCSDFNAFAVCVFLFIYWHINGLQNKFIAIILLCEYVFAAVFYDFYLFVYIVFPKWIEVRSMFFWFCVDFADLKWGANNVFCVQAFTFHRRSMMIGRCFE